MPIRPAVWTLWWAQMDVNTCGGAFEKEKLQLIRHERSSFAGCLRLKTLPAPHRRCLTVAPIRAWRGAETLLTRGPVGIFTMSCAARS